MTQQIQAIYEQGVLRPLKPIELNEGEKIEIVLVRPQREVGKILSEIAKLPIEGEVDEFSGANHDEILYPKKQK